MDRISDQPAYIALKRRMSAVLRGRDEPTQGGF
jgi:hypothetical protein